MKGKTAADRDGLTTAEGDSRKGLIKCMKWRETAAGITARLA